jgi:RNA polymerase sigma factor (sigma-70 family)
LLRRFLATGDAGSFETIVLRHGRQVFSTCRRMLSCEHDADDAFQETFLVLTRRAAQVRHLADLGGWLHGVACRVAKKAQERWARHRRLAAEVASFVSQADSGEHTRELALGMEEELARLPEQFRKPILLCYYRSLSRKEAARLLACSVPTLDRNLRKARSRLKARLDAPTGT